MPITRSIEYQCLKLKFLIQNVKGHFRPFGDWATFRLFEFQQQQAADYSTIKERLILPLIHSNLFDLDFLLMGLLSCNTPGGAVY